MKNKPAVGSSAWLGRWWGRIWKRAAIGATPPMPARHAAPSLGHDQPDRTLWAIWARLVSCGCALPQNAHVRDKLLLSRRFLLQCRILGFKCHYLFRCLIFEARILILERRIRLLKRRQFFGVVSHSGVERPNDPDEPRERKETK